MLDMNTHSWTNLTPPTLSSSYRIDHTLSRLSSRQLLRLSAQGVETYDVEKGKWRVHADILKKSDLSFQHGAVEVPFNDEVLVVRIGGKREVGSEMWEYSSKQIVFQLLE